MTKATINPIEGGDWRLTNGRLVRDDGSAPEVPAPVVAVIEPEPAPAAPAPTPEPAVSPAPVIKPSRDRKDY